MKIFRNLHEKSREITFGELIFLAGFRHLEPLCTITEASVIEAAAAANEAKTTAVESASLVALLA